MHTATYLSSEMFEIQDGGDKVSPSELLDWGPFDRLGVIVNAPFGGLGASLLIQVATTAFYDSPGRDRRRRPVYPEIYLFHVGAKHGNHSAFDFWPPRKEIFVENDHVDVLGSVNSHGITHLVVPEGPAQNLKHHFKEPDAAADRIKQCYAYGYDGIVEDSTLRINAFGAAPIENSAKSLRPGPMLEFLASRRLPPLQRVDNERVIENYRRRAAEVPNAIHEERSKRFDECLRQGRITETYRRIDLKHALDRLCMDLLS
ncbi:hypothetical protein A6V36_18040 [Paraburkholderia ginsengiterrae]|uniref:Uncharacterized protein n=1 Tax=Paraburkholderia ginsengiterrae TaxID=1462993 RepID=A0A1A9MX88_9BURK|nr:hypothetical protein [Paraburkholderia ginsengiterrae]OAJ52034.1 hypothetical protein A6V37_10220 [Paraburkholderia ginsengiterrae]OAJ63395.1 hypothetical protein A6V36_18040 [Paraburkholderia ginsengiterrae]